MIPQTFIDEVLSRVDLPGFISSYVPELVKISAGNYTACCPFHSEKSPSFTVTPKKGFYHCFGCGAHGNAINFVIEYKQLPFVEALKEVAAFVGMEIPKPDKPQKNQQEREDAARYMRARGALDTAQGIYVTKLQANKDAMDYLLNERGITAETIQKFGIGFAPDKWDTITGSRSLSKDAIEDAGLSSKSDKSKQHHYDRFRDRIMFPIYQKEHVLGFGGRALHGQEPKYLNSPETVVFKKGSVLYGLPQAIDSIYQLDRVYVVEGYMDDVMLYQYGVTNVVASLGTSVTDEQIKRLFALCGHVTFCMDGDKAGRKAAWRVAENILPFMDGKHKVDFMFLPDGVDPDEFVKSDGKEAFDLAASYARTLTEYILDVFKRCTDMNNAESMAKYFTVANEMAMKMPDGALRLSFQKQIAEGANVSLDTMLARLNKRIEKADVPTEAATLVQPAPMSALSDSSNISVAAKIIGLAAIVNREFSGALNLDYLSRYLGQADKEMLLPLLAYVRANPQANIEAIVASLSFNTHAKMIKSLVIAAKTAVGVDFTADAKAVLDSFTRMESIWRAVQAAKEETLEAKSQSRLAS